MTTVLTVDREEPFCWCPRCECQAVRNNLAAIQNHDYKVHLEYALSNSRTGVFSILALNLRMYERLEQNLWHDRTTKNPFPTDWYPGINNRDEPCRKDGTKCKPECWWLLVDLLDTMTVQLMAHHKENLDLAWKYHRRQIARMGKKDGAIYQRLSNVWLKRMRECPDAVVKITGIPGKK